VALIREAAALATSCAGADLVVSPVPAGELCQAPRIIDSLATQKAGAHAVWLNPGSVRVETVLEWRGERRWTVP
jgi:competence protein ComEC